MPFVRISHPAGKNPAYAAALSQGVHRALVEAIGISADDMFQVVTEHIVGSGIIGSSVFLGIVHSPEMVFIQITITEGRTVAQKRDLYRIIADNLHADPGIPPSDVIINLVETKRENWSFGNGEAQFAEPLC